jgi:hypothetical protein
MFSRRQDRPSLEISLSNHVEPVRTDSRDTSEDCGSSGPSNRKISFVSNRLETSGGRHIPDQQDGGQSWKQLVVEMDTNCLGG